MKYSSIVTSVALAIGMSLLPLPSQGSVADNCSHPDTQDKYSLEPSEEYFGAYRFSYWNSDRKCSNDVDMGLYHDDFHIHLVVNVDFGGRDSEVERVKITVPPGYYIESGRDSALVEDGQEVIMLIIPALF